MKIEKIKNFNQIILAIAGVLGLILLFIFLVSTVWDYYRLEIGSGRGSAITNSLISEEEVEMLSMENLRLQIVSYESPKLVDTLNAVYIIPVSVSTLDKPETVVESIYDDGLMALMDTYGSTKKNGYYRENYFDGLFANIIVYQPILNRTTLLFNERIMLSGLHTYDFEDDILIVFYTAEKDNNNDGLVNFKDDTNLCIYSLKSGKMRRIAEQTTSITDYQFVDNSKDLLVEFSLSQYNDVKFKSYKPRKIMKYEFETEILSEVVPAEIQQQLQNLVDGKKAQQK